MTPQTMETKYDWVCLIYEIRWKCEEKKYFNENLSDWFYDLTSTNIDGVQQWTANGTYSTERPAISSYFWISFPKIYQRGYNTLLRSSKIGKTDRYDV